MAGIGDLVANLTVNSAPWKKGLGEAKSSMSTFAGGITKLVSPLAGAIAAAWGTSASVAAYKTQLQAQQKLQAVFAATGNAAGLSSQEVATFASDLQSVTNIGDEVTIASAAVLASFTKIKGDLFTDTLKSAADLAAVLGGELEPRVKMLGKSLEDPAKGMEQLREVGVSFTVAQQNQVKSLQATGDLLGAQRILLGEVENRFGGAAQAMADPWTQLKNSIGDVGEIFGSLLLPTIDVLSTELNAVTGGIGTFGGTFKSIGIEVAATMGMVLEFWREVGSGIADSVVSLTDIFGGWFNSVGMGIDSFSDLYVEVYSVLDNIGTVAGLTATKMELFFVGIGNDAAYFFTDQVPGYLDWFGNNWRDVLFTAGDYAATVFINLGQNIRDLWSSVMNFIKGKGFDFDWTPLTKGAVSAIKELPNIPDRVTTDFEKSLQNDIAAMTENLTTGIAESRQKLTASVEEKRSALTARYGGSSGIASTGLLSNSETSRMKPPQMASSMTRGSADALKTIFNSRRSPEAAATDKLTNAVNHNVAKPLQEIAKNTKPQFAPEFA